MSNLQVRVVGQITQVNHIPASQQIEYTIQDVNSTDGKQFVIVYYLGVRFWIFHFSHFFADFKEFLQQQR